MKLHEEMEKNGDLHCLTMKNGDLMMFWWDINGILMGIFGGMNGDNHEKSHIFRIWLEKP
jgi:hypothetical protein